MAQLLSHGLRVPDDRPQDPFLDQHGEAVIARMKDPLTVHPHRHGRVDVVRHAPEGADGAQHRTCVGICLEQPGNHPGLVGAEAARALEQGAHRLLRAFESGLFHAAPFHVLPVDAARSGDEVGCLTGRAADPRPRADVRLGGGCSAVLQA